ncbi:MAG: hypothetical protein R3D02_07445 [Hyphomicrobiales bacterium]
MPEFSRRHLLLAGAAFGAACALPAMPAILKGGAAERVLVVGGGKAGAAAALAERSTRPDAGLLLVERDPTQLRPAAGESLVAGPARGAGFARLHAAGIEVAVDEIRDIDWVNGRAGAISGRVFGFDRIVVAPGISGRDEGIAGYDGDAADFLPHGWFGTASTRRLAAQIRAMADGGTVLIRIPAGRMRFADGPFARAAEIAAYLGRNKPASKVLVLDHGDTGAGRAQRIAGNSDGRIEYISGREFGAIERVDAAGRVLFGVHGQVRADVINFIPAQKAGEIAERAGLADATGWCPADAGRKVSCLQPRAILAGDAAFEREDAIAS